MGCSILRLSFAALPVSYFAPYSGIGLAFSHLRQTPSPLRVGIVGLGAGALAAYAEPGDTFRFYEINPLVVELAKREFTYCRTLLPPLLSRSGDGRLSLEREPDQNFDLLVFDAFYGDAISCTSADHTGHGALFTASEPGESCTEHLETLTSIWRRSPNSLGAHSAGRSRSSRARDRTSIRFTMQRGFCFLPSRLTILISWRRRNRCRRDQTFASGLTTTAISSRCSGK